MCMIGQYRRTLQIPWEKPLRAWRTFRQDAQGGLRSLAVGYQWKRVNLSGWWIGSSGYGGFDPDKSQEPLRKNHVGLWAYKSERAAVSCAAGTGDVVRPVKLCGKVIEHRDGYRAAVAILPYDWELPQERRT